MLAYMECQLVTIFLFGAFYLKEKRFTQWAP